MMRFLLYLSLGIILLNSPIQILYASNKESFELKEENFSTAAHINYDGLAEELRYSFKDQKLLKAALYPLLKQDRTPSKVQLAKKQFEHLEFYGDSVLGCFIRERLIKLLPDQDRGDLAQLYDSLTENKTLADVYLRHLSIERFLPFPEKPSCKYCNVVEAIIGAISLDDSINGPKNARKFIMFILDDHLLQEQIKSISGLQNITLTKLCLPHVKEVLTQVCSPERIQNESPKSLLHEVLSIAWMDYPTYTVTMRTNTLKLPILYASVSGAQIGREFTDLHGEGYTRQEAEENAAIEALNFLAQKELIPKAKIDTVDPKYTTLLKIFIDLKRSEGTEFVPRNPLLDQFKLHLIFNEKIIGEGAGILKEEAKEKAAQQGYNYLSKEMSTPQVQTPLPKNYRQLIKELNDQRSSHKIELIETPPADGKFTCQAKIGDTVIGEGSGSSKNSAREEAAEKAYNQQLGDLSNQTDQKKPTKNFRTRLEELAVTRDLKINHRWTYKHVLTFDNKNFCITETGLTAAEAKEKTSKAACYELIRFEEETNHRRNSFMHSTSSVASTPTLPVPQAATSSGMGSKETFSPTKTSAPLPKAKTVSSPSSKTSKKQKLKKKPKNNEKS